MAATVTKLRSGSEVLGKRRIHFVDLALDNSYPTGGYSIAASALGARAIEGLSVIGGVPAVTAGGYAYMWDTANNKLMVLEQDGTGAFAQVANTTNLSAITALRCVIYTRQGQ